MFFKWAVSAVNNEQVLFLYLQNDYEFAKELFNKSNNEGMINKINDYILNNNIIFNGNKVYLVSKNLVIGSATIKNNEASKVKSFVDIDKIFDDEIEIIDVTSKEKEDNIKQQSIAEIEKRFIIKNYKEDIELETINVILAILHSNLLLELKRYGYIKSTKFFVESMPLNNVSNSFIERINKSINEINNTIILTNNVHRELALLSYESRIMSRINTMTKAGYNYKQIISFFYPNSSVKKIN